MNKSLALVGYLGPNYNLLGATSLVATELAAMGSILKKMGYDVAVACPESVVENITGPPTGLQPWDQTQKPEILWFHQSNPNFPGGICEKRGARLDVVAKAITQADIVLRLLVDNNGSLDHTQIKYIKTKRNNTPACLTIVDEIAHKIEQGKWFEVGWEDCRSRLNLPFIDCGITAEQLLITKELLGGPQEKIYDFCYVGARRHDKAEEGRGIAMAPFVDHQPSFYKGSFFKNRSSFANVWSGMASSRGHLIAREKTMVHLPLHRYMQALILDAVPIVVGESEPVEFINDPDLQNILRVSSLEEGLKLLEKADELKPLLEKELQYWINYDLSRQLKLP